MGILRHAAAPPAGSVDANTASPAAARHSDADGHETSKIPPPRCTTAVRHEPGDAGAVEVTIEPSDPAPTHRPADGHDKTLTAGVKASERAGTVAESIRLGADQRNVPAAAGAAHSMHAAIDNRQASQCKRLDDVLVPFAADVLLAADSIAGV